MHVPILEAGQSRACESHLADESGPNRDDDFEPLSPKAGGNDSARGKSVKVHTVDFLQFEPLASLSTLMLRRRALHTAPCRRTFFVSESNGRQQRTLERGVDTRAMRAWIYLTHSVFRVVVQKSTPSPQIRQLVLFYY